MLGLTSGYDSGTLRALRSAKRRVHLLSQPVVKKMPAAFGGRTRCTRGEKFLPLAGIEAATSAKLGAGFMPNDSRRCHRLRKRPAGRRLHSRRLAHNVRAASGYTPIQYQSPAGAAACTSASGMRRPTDERARLRFSPIQIFSSCHTISIMVAFVTIWGVPLSISMCILSFTQKAMGVPFGKKIYLAFSII